MDFAKVDRRRNADWFKSSGCNHGAGREKRVRGATANENRCTPVELPDNVFTVGRPINKPALVLGGSWGFLGVLGGSGGEVFAWEVRSGRRWPPSKSR